MTTTSVPASGTVHWVGAGLSNGRTALGLLADQTDRLVLWGRDAARLSDRVSALGLTGRVGTGILGGDTLAGQVLPGDVVVSMLPAAEHARLLAIARRKGAHFACSSYVSEAILSAADGVTQEGLVVLTEAGLDPGIDHLMAHHLVAQAREAVGDHATGVRFTSYCGGVPEVPGEFCYRFSWAPYGVLAALTAPATYLDSGREVTAPHPWEVTSTYQVAGETFDVYPNRDSLPFVEQYGVPRGWQVEQFVRGTLRNAGWRNAWSEVFEVVRAGEEPRLRALAQDLAERYPTTEQDRDRVVLVVELQVDSAAGRWCGRYRLDLVGAADESAMARCVSLPLAHGVSRILDGALRPGVHRAVEDPEEVAHWLSHLSAHGVRCHLQVLA